MSTAPRRIRAVVNLDHKTGPVAITIEAATPQVAAYLANRLREVFSGKTPDRAETMDELFERMGRGGR